MTTVLVNEGIIVHSSRCNSKSKGIIVHSSRSRGKSREVEVDCNVDTVVDTVMVNEGIIGGKWCRGGRGGGGGGGAPINFTTLVLLDSRNSKKHFRKIGENLK